MTSKPIVKAPNKSAKITHPGMMGDGTEKALRDLDQTCFAIGRQSMRFKAESRTLAINARIEYFPILPCMVFGDLHRGLSGDQSRN